MILHLPLFPYLLYLHPMTLLPISLILHLHLILINSHTIHHQSQLHGLNKNPILGIWIASPSRSCLIHLRGLWHCKKGDGVMCCPYSCIATGCITVASWLESSITVLTEVQYH